MRRVLLLLIAIGANAVSARAQEIIEEVFEQKYAVDPTAKFSLQNDDGSVFIYGADISEMRLQAIKKAYTKDRLSGIKVDVAVQPGTIAIKTGYPPKPKWGLRDRSGTVDYVIVLPWFCNVESIDLGNGEVLIDGMRGNQVKARLGSGRLFGHNCFTDLHLNIETGGIEVAYEWWEKHPIAVTTQIGVGNTWVFVPENAKFRLNAETANGRIFSDFSSPQDRTGTNQTKLNLDIGPAPTADMKIHAVNGSIRIEDLSR